MCRCKYFRGPGRGIPDMRSTSELSNAVILPGLGVVPSLPLLTKTVSHHWPACDMPIESPAPTRPQLQLQLQHNPAQHMKAPGVRANSLTRAVASRKSRPSPVSIALTARRLHVLQNPTSRTQHRLVLHTAADASWTLLCATG